MISPILISNSNFVTIANQSVLKEERATHSYRSQLYSACATKQATPEAAPWLQTQILSWSRADASASSFAYRACLLLLILLASSGFQLDHGQAPLPSPRLAMGTGKCPFCLPCTPAGETLPSQPGEYTVPHIPAGTCCTLTARPKVFKCLHPSVWKKPMLKFCLNSFKLYFSPAFAAFSKSTVVNTVFAYWGGKKKKEKKRTTEKHKLI